MKENTMAEITTALLVILPYLLVLWLSLTVQSHLNELDTEALLKGFRHDNELREVYQQELIREISDLRRELHELQEACGEVLDWTEISEEDAVSFAGNASTLAALGQIGIAASRHEQRLDDESDGY